jgi:hypothetical protein
MPLEGPGKQYSFSQIEGIWIQATHDTKMAPIMAAIAEAESSGWSNNVNPNHQAYGLWQIDNGTTTPFASNWSNPIANAGAAYAKLHSQGLGAWAASRNVWSKDPRIKGGIPPTNVKGVGGSKGGTGGTGGTGGAGSGPILGTLASFLGGGPLAQFVTDPIDALERIGLVIFGAILILVGIMILAMPTGSRILGATAGTSRDFRAASNALGGGIGAGGSRPVDPAKAQERQERLNLAQRNVALGERKQDFRESRERRISQGRRHKGAREPNPNPKHA